ncbi:MAG: NAD(P)-binding domain-containing protein [Nitrospira sp.]|nr:NAD(P)-binding domain-containing protein [Nitrospira sp.]
MNMAQVVIIGAGPYGLSLAAYLKARGVNFRIFGNPMGFWLKHMPKGMRLKSEGFASFLYDPDSAFTLKHYCERAGLAYADLGLPVPLETFTSYGLEFQKRFVPELEDKLVVSVRRAGMGFQVSIEDGEIVKTQQVVLAVGLTYYAYLPPILSSLPKELVSHSSAHNCLDRFKGREVAVVGAGASALDLAALLHQAGALVQLVARGSEIHFHTQRIKPPTLIDQLRAPITGIGPGWKLFWCTNLPLVFRLMPERFRFLVAQKILGPAPGWFIKEEVVDKVPFNLGVTITEASAKNGRVYLQLTDSSGSPRTLVTDHVIAATGYKVDLRRLTFLDSEIQSGMRSVDHTPILSSKFESSVPGLYLVGVSATHTFGPLLRFAFGARFTAARLSRHLAKV